MNNELIKQNNWWNNNWKWLITVSIISLIMAVFISFDMGAIGADLTKAYSDKQLYENALLKVKSNQKVIELLGEIEPIDKLAILEGEVKYTDDNRTVKSSIRIKGSTGKGRMDIIADRVNKEWKYKIINVRIKNPPEKKQTIEIIKTQKR